MSSRPLIAFPILTVNCEYRKWNNFASAVLLHGFRIDELEIEFFFKFFFSSSDEISIHLFLRSEQVVLGEYDTETNPDCDENGCAAPRQIIKIAKIFIPYNYNAEIYSNDIVVVKLEQPAVLNGNRILFAVEYQG